MGNFIPRKYNTNLVIGLAVAVVLAAIVIGYLLYYRNSKPQSQSHPQQSAPQADPHQSAPPRKPMDTRVDSPEPDVPTLVLYWDEGCMWSQRMKPEWDKVYAILNAEGSGFRAVDFELKRDVSDFETARRVFGQNFRGVPFIVFFPDGYGQGKPSLPYAGNRTEEDLLRFVYSHEH
jgi:hypothetical protein